MVRAAYPAMELAARFVIVPLAFASLLTGVIQSLGTPWGLFRHYWVLVKLLLTHLCDNRLAEENASDWLRLPSSVRDTTVQRSSPDGRNPARCPRRRRDTGVARGDDTFGIQALGPDELRAA